EVKFDGYRALAYVDGGDCVLRSRNDNDLTARFSAVATSVARSVEPHDAVVDGEVVALDERGRPSFSAMQQGSRPCVYYAFDLLELAGEPLVELPLEERRARLAEVLAKPPPGVSVSEGFDDGEALLDAAREQGLEGIMAKRLGCRYQQGRRTRE